VARAHYNLGKALKSGRVREAINYQTKAYWFEIKADPINIASTIRELARAEAVAATSRLR
jgi:hypothetical protein